MYNEKVRHGSTFLDFDVLVSMKRVFIGGLFPEVTEGEIRDRFGRFGEVEDVEIKRKKTDGESLDKTFAYVNLNISEESLSKCFSVYNKTKWKGSQLKLQLAKEDFLKRLIKERENGFAVESKVKPKKGMHHDPLQNELGIQDFEMRGAVPGTSIQGEDWVVGKYGRVLPVVHITNKHSKKIMTVDPSKFCHNLTKVKEDSGVSVGGTTEELTWELAEENPEKVKRRTGDVRSTSKFVRRKRGHITDSTLDTSKKVNHKEREEDDFEVVSVKESVAQCKARLGAGAESDSDSDYESIKHSYTKTKTRIPASASESLSVENECEKESERSKPDTAGGLSSKTCNISNDSQVSKETSDGSSNTNIKVNGVVNFIEDKSDSESVSSADTDIIVAKQHNRDSGRTFDKISYVSATQGVNEYSDGITLQECRKESNDFQYESDDSLTAVGYARLAKRIEMEYQKNNKIDSLKSTEDQDVRPIKEKTSDSQKQKTVRPIKEKTSDSQKQRFNAKDSKMKIELKQDSVMDAVSVDITDGDSDRESDSSVDAVPDDITDDDLEKESDSSVVSVSGSSSCEESPYKFDAVNKSVLNQSSRTASFENTSQKSKPKCVIPPFRGTSTLYRSDDGKESQKKCINTENVEESRTENCSPASPVKGTAILNIPSKNSKTAKKGEVQTTQDCKLTNKQGQDTAGCEISENRQNPAKDNVNLPLGRDLQKTGAIKIADKDKKQRSLDSDKRRLESIMERSKETEMRKKAIKQALSLDSKAQKPNKRIVFDNSDTEDEQKDENEDEIQTKDKVQLQREKGPALFDSSSEDEEDRDRDEERFRVRPEFEGKAGKKLMKLQSRFKNDERFKMDEKFIDASGSEDDGSSDEENRGFKLSDEIDDEKSRALKILGEVVGPKALKKVQKKKTIFKDVSAIHFDPTREDHKQFEMEPQKKKKKTTAETKKVIDFSEEEEPAEEVPEVTKEKFYQVSLDSFKDVFSDKTSDRTDTQFSLLNAFGRQQESRDSDEDMSEPEQLETSVSQKGSFLMKQDDGSSNENMSSDEEAQINMPVNLFTISQSTFFFTEDDERVKEGIHEFYRKEDLETIREKWLENRQSLVNAYRAKHKSMSRKKKIAEKRKRTK
ncbi:nucleolar protein 8-like isoform X2 [Ostrea edulis]|uniref:nucleolar protein 8-like isoform X2 n=1 Tax=Ostrea edulis TaxID=37623 RepID=UPI0024AFF319|nr:nucleolar protein 8-like isoform X2 [Ostrea edulis]